MDRDNLQFADHLPQTRRANRSGYVEHDDFEGSPSLRFHLPRDSS
jgi:hypothetical protein